MLAKENVEVATENAGQLSILGVYSDKMLSEVITNSCNDEGPFHMHK